MNNKISMICMLSMTCMLSVTCMLKTHYTMLITIDSNEKRVALMRNFCSMTNCDREINCDRVTRTLVE